MENNEKSTSGINLAQIRNLFRTRSDDREVGRTSANIRNRQETYHEWGVRWSGNADGNVSALNPALQSCYSQNVTEQNDNIDLQRENQINIESEIERYRGKRNGEDINLKSKEHEKKRLEEEAEDLRVKIDEIKSSDKTDIMAKVNFYIGLSIAVLLAIYLFVFYSSASFSAFFGNDNITGAGEAILDSHCYSEALDNGIGQLLFILLMPVIFLGLGFLIHQFGESETGVSKYIKIGCLFLVTFIFDALLAFEISQKVYLTTDIDATQYTVTMAINSPDFWIVIFSGFVAYVIWGMVFDFTLQHFDKMNTHTKEIKVLEDKIKNKKVSLDEVMLQINAIQLKINELDTKISALQTRFNSGSLIDTNVLRRALSDFFNGWVAYMTLAAKPETEKDRATDVYNSFIANIQ